MKRLVIIVALLVIALLTGLAKEPMPPVRLANGQSIKGEIQSTNAAGLTLLSTEGAIAYPWAALSVGTRYRHERPFQEAQEIARSNAALKAQAAAASAKAAAQKAAAQTSVHSNASDQTIATNISVLAVEKESTSMTNVESSATVTNTVVSGEDDATPAIMPLKSTLPRDAVKKPRNIL